jgi:arylsulfatase
MPRQPNILLLFTDQQRGDTIAALGNPFIQTPTLDRLAAEGTAFTSAYTPSPVCVAARCSLLLGRYPHQTGCTGNTPMPQDQTSLMEHLASAGYQTHGTGKMHFVPDSDKLWGFETRDTSEEGGLRAGDGFSEHLIAHGYGHVMNPNGLRSEYYYLPQPSQLPEPLHHTHWVADRSLAFLARRDRGRPFFLWSSFIKPHPPFETPLPWSRLYKPVEMPPPWQPPQAAALTTFWNRVQNRYKYRDQGADMNLLRTMRAAYHAAISHVDYHAGRILAQLEAEGELDNTLVLYSADHGELLGDFGSFGKRSMLDAAARVPLLARFPERFAAGGRCDEVASLVDVLPTCLQAAGAALPAQAAGVDLAALAAGESPRDAVFSQFMHGSLGLYAVIGREHKYLYSAPDDREWLLSRREPWRESTNLAGHPGCAGALAGLRTRLQEQYRRDGYAEPLEGDGWRRYPRREVPDDPDAWQLYQEGGDVAPLFPQGYGPRVPGIGGPSLESI